MTGPLPDGPLPFDAGPQIAVSWERKLARRCSKHPGPWRHLREQVMRVALYYSQTRSRQEAGLFWFQRMREEESWRERPIGRRK